MSDRPDIEAITERQRMIDYNRFDRKSRREPGMFRPWPAVLNAKDAQLNAIPDLLAYIKSLELVLAAPTNPPVTPGTGGDR